MRLGLGLQLNKINNKSGITPVTSGLTLDAIWDSITPYYEFTVTAARQASSAAVYATFDNADNGILMESGGAGSGFVLYIFDGVLYFQCGSGSSFGSAINRAEIAWAIPSPTPKSYLIEWSADSSNAELFIDGVSVGSDTNGHGFITGVNEGGIGQSYGTVALVRGGWVGDNDGIFTGVIDRAEIFAGETV